MGTGAPDPMVILAKLEVAANDRQWPADLRLIDKHGCGPLGRCPHPRDDDREGDEDCSISNLVGVMAASLPAGSGIDRASPESLKKQRMKTELLRSQALFCALYDTQRG